MRNITSMLIAGLAGIVVACAPAGQGDEGAPGGASDAPPATELLATAIERMGGIEALRGIERVRFDMITRWYRLNYAGGPYADGPSDERHTDVRDYTLEAWRNTREFGAGRKVVDLVRGDVAVRDFGQGFEPLNIAYVDERRELFAYTPDRLVLGLRDAPDLAALPDTTIAGAAHGRVRGTIDGFDMTLHLRRGDALPAMVRFRAAHPNDFGLVPWGTMEIEVWYSGWRTLEGGVSLPTQWAIERIGQLYKRLTVTRTVLNPEFDADSFAVSDELATAYRETATRPMHDLPLDSARVEGDFARFGAFGSPAGAVRVGDGWLLLETGQAELSVDRATAWLAENAPGRLLGAVATMLRGNGGAAALAERGTPVFTGPGIAPYLEVVLRNHGVSTGAPQVVREDRWIVDGADSVLVAPLDLPDSPGSALVYSPRLSWIYAADAVRPLDHMILRDLVERREWSVEWIGNARALRQPFGQ